MEIETINKIAYGIASHNRDEANRGKNINQKGYVSKEAMRKDAAKIAGALAALCMASHEIAKMWKKYAPKYGKFHATVITFVNCLAIFAGVFAVVFLINGEFLAFLACLYPAFYVFVYILWQKFVHSQWANNRNSRLWFKLLKLSVTMALIVGFFLPFSWLDGNV